MTHEAANQINIRSCGIGVKDLPDDLTPFITRTTQDHISGGGFGDVWKCNYDADGISTVVAVKAFRYPEQYHDSERIDRKISREIGILKILCHTNIVPLLGTVTGFGRRSELRSLVTPWIPNGTLNAYLASNHNDLTLLDRSRLLKDVSAGLQYLHSKYIIHGDITGANILIDEGGQAKLIDFGLSTIIRPLFGQSHLAATSVRPGQIRYAAPELVLSQDVRDILLEKTDIYSFGCVMLQILSGLHPWFKIKSDNQIVVDISKGRGPQRPDGDPTIMDSDWGFIQTCLQFGPELRPSADEVLDFVIRRFSSPDSSSPFDDPPNDAWDGFLEAPPHHDSDDSDATEHTSNSPQPHSGSELTNAITEFRVQRSSPSSLNTGSLPPLPSLGTGPVTAFGTDSRVVRSTSVLRPEQRQSSPLSLPPAPNVSLSNRKTRWVGDDNRLFQAFGRLFSKGRYFTCISDIPHETQIALILTPGLPSSTSQVYSDDHNVLCWKVFHLGPGRRQEVVHLPSRGPTGDPGLVFCTLDARQSGYMASEISLGAASIYIQNGTIYEWVPSACPGISVGNQTMHDVLFALATMSGEGSADPFWAFTLPPNCSRNFAGSIYLHAFRTTGVTPGSRLDFSEPDFLANRITEEGGLEVSRLGPTTYWYFYQYGDQLKVKIAKSRKDIKRYKHQLELGDI